jgi:sterol carrier protein 2
VLKCCATGGSCVVTLFARPSFFLSAQTSDKSKKNPDGRDRLGYNHGEECRTISRGDVEKVRSRKAYSKWAESRI